MAARLTSSLFISAIIRQVNVDGGFAAVIRRGADEAGAIFICVPGGAGAGTALYAQVPQVVIADREDVPAGGRLFELVADRLSDVELAQRFEKETRLDPDFWVLELEVRDSDISAYVGLT
ncbi:DUF1491 family protein [Oricola sp.]|uniref:DUF1491 family protein n=1 Tax=Oricola sp. TaxID=1979950 RepID=UPI003BAAECCA